MKALITGAEGQLGRILLEVFAQRPDVQCIPLPLEELDITDALSIRSRLEEQKPDWIINTAAYTAVDQAEDEPEKAEAVNATAVGLLAREAERSGIAMLHFSTDYVFDGNQEGIERPCVESDPPNPLSVYARTKLEGEAFLRSTLERHVILRTAWLFSEYGNNFVLKILEKIKRGENLNVVVDQIGSPTYARDLAEFILKILERPRWGTYHVVNRDPASWHDLARAVVDEWGSGLEAGRIRTASLNQKAERPAYSVLDPSLAESTFGAAMRPWRSALRDMIRNLKGE